jgi:hypothetical protein
MHPRTTIDFPRRSHSASTLWRGVSSQKAVTGQGYQPQKGAAGYVTLDWGRAGTGSAKSRLLAVRQSDMPSICARVEVRAGDNS